MQTRYAIIDEKALRALTDAAGRGVAVMREFEDKLDAMGQGGARLEVANARMVLEGHIRTSHSAPLTLTSPFEGAD